MKAVFLALFVSLAVAVSGEEAPPSPVFDYHRREGIPKASQIKAFEEQTSNQRIVGGDIVDISEHPYQVGLIMQILWIFNSVCGGSIISEDKIVTAAHCNFDGAVTAQRTTVVAGSNTIFSGGQRIDIDSVTMHPQWNPSTAANDVSILKIRALNFNSNVQSIPLPSGDEISNDFNAYVGVASGYGLTSDSGSIGNNQVLSSVSLHIIPNSQCAAVFGPFVHASNVCTSGLGGRSTCSGDSGGPLVVPSNGRNILVGITSFGAAEGCTLGFPAAFARVSSFVDWISSA